MKRYAKRFGAHLSHTKSEVRGLRHSVQGMRIRRVAGVVRVVRAALLPVEADRCRIDWSVDGERQQRRAAM